VFGKVFGEPQPAVPQPPLITAWSYSRLQVYNKCPRQAKYKFVDRLPEGPEGPAIVRGKLLHDASAALVAGQRPTTWDDEQERLFTPRLPLYNSMHEHGFKPEQQAAFTIDWEPTDWFGPRAWLRVVFDAVGTDQPGTLSVLEVKSGKVYPEHKEQETLYAAAGVALDPSAKEIEVGMLYLDQPTLPVKATRYSAEQAKALQPVWEEKARPMLTDTIFPARAGPYCQWCPYSGRHRNGPCEVG
jgi:hypothetical protein